MQVIAAQDGVADCEGRGETRRVRTALVGDVALGQWLLVFIDSAQEKITPERAHEVNATLDMIASAMTNATTFDEPAFALPSQMSTLQLQALTGQIENHSMETNQ